MIYFGCLASLILIKNVANHESGEVAPNFGTLYLTCKPDIPIDKEKSIYWFNEVKN